MEYVTLADGDTNAFIGDFRDGSVDAVEVKRESPTDVPSTMRQVTFIQALSPVVVSSSSSSAAAAPYLPDEMPIHVSVQCFTDCVWVLVTEDATCAPGVVVRFDPMTAAPNAFMYEGETPSLECTVLLGMRDNPLTNLLASTVAFGIRQYGEMRPIVMCLSVAKVGHRLASAAEKKIFLSQVKQHVMNLSTETMSGEKLS